MNFNPRLAAKVLDGTKTVTRRRLSDNPRSPWWREECRYMVGRDYAVCPGRGESAIGRIKILDVRKQRLGAALQGTEPYLEGFQLATGFKRVWKEMHGSFDHEELVWRVRFEVFDG